MRPAGVARLRELLIAALAVLDDEDQQAEAREAANDAAPAPTRPRKPPRRAPPRPRGPVDAKLVDRAAENLRRRGIAVVTGGGGRSR